MPHPLGDPRHPERCDKTDERQHGLSCGPEILYFRRGIREASNAFIHHDDEGPRSNKDERSDADPLSSALDDVARKRCAGRGEKAVAR
jgi:hypothetical protein